MRDTLVLAPHDKDLGGGFTVRRLLPAAACRSVGPFVFFDHFGPVTAGPDDNHDVRPHPHIGLATVTYLYEGALVHHDSTGARQRIEPGEINWMTAGRGIVHSERTPAELRDQVRLSHGLQLWAALPAELETCEPAFHHTGSDGLPWVPSQLLPAGVALRVLVGTVLAQRAAVATPSPTLFADLTLAPNAAWSWVPEHTPEAVERAVYATAGSLSLNGQALAPHAMAVLAAESVGTLTAGPDGARVAMIGGATVGPRFLYWNFVSSQRERLVQASDDWAAGRFDRVPGETEFIPLPDRRLA
jgi:redox-sensitive bicupin YhaK (pirin superfamily)